MYEKQDDKSQEIIHKKILTVSEGEKIIFIKHLMIRHDDFCDKQYFEVNITLRFGMLNQCICSGLIIFIFSLSMYVWSNV